MKTRPSDWFTFHLALPGSIIAIVAAALLLNFTGDCAPGDSIMATFPAALHGWRAFAAEVGTSRRRLQPIFQIGFNKCGTRSLHYFLRDSGIRSAHWEKGELARRMSRRILAGQDPIRDFPKIVGFTDMISVEPGVLFEPYKRFDYLHHWYPNATFILNTRDRERWITSRSHHVRADGHKLQFWYAHCLGISEAEVPDYWRAEWDTHHALARAYFREAPNFLEFNIERDDPNKLRNFLAQRYPTCTDTPFERRHKTVPAQMAFPNWSL